jgi:hypothetical protein
MAKAEKATSTKKPNSAFSKPLQPSQELAAVVGSSPLPRTEVVSKVLGLHQKAQAAGPAEQARDRCRRQAEGSVREG